jgi:hypothetical protein
MDKFQLFMRIAYTAEKFIGSGQTGDGALPANRMDII